MPRTDDFQGMKCVIHFGKEKEKVLQGFQDKRAELVIKRLQDTPHELLKSVHLFPLPKAS